MKVTRFLPPLALASVLSTLGCTGDVTDSSGVVTFEPARTVTVLASIDDLDFPGYLAVGPSSIYWLEDNIELGGSVRALPKGGGPASIFADHQEHPTNLTFAGDQLYWTTTGLRSSPVAGGPGTVLAVGFGSTGGIGVDGDDVYAAIYDNGVHVLRIDAESHARTDLFAGDDFDTIPGAFALTPRVVVWSTSDWNASTLWVMPREGGTPQAIATSPSERTALAADATHAFWVQETGAIDAIPLDGGPTIALAAGSSPTAVAIDEDFVYWGDSDNVMRVAKTGGPPEVIARNQLPVASLALDATHVYWLASTRLSDWEIRTAAK
jgi:hypothetical protein